MLDRLQTLATESAATTFTGDRNNINMEYQQLVAGDHAAGLPTSA